MNYQSFAPPTPHPAAFRNKEGKQGKHNYLLLFIKLKFGNTIKNKKHQIIILSDQKRKKKQNKPSQIESFCKKC